MASRPGVSWDGGPLFHQIQPIGRGLFSEDWQNNPNFPTQVNGPSFDGMDAEVIEQGMIKPDSETNGPQTHNMTLDYRGSKEQALLDHWAGDLLFARELNPNGTRRHIDGTPASNNEAKSLQRLNMYLKSDTGRQQYPGTNAHEVMQAWRMIGFQGVNMDDPRSEVVLHSIGGMRTRALVPYAKDGHGIYLLLVKRRLSDIEAACNVSDAEYKQQQRMYQQEQKQQRQQAINGSDDDGISNIDMDEDADPEEVKNLADTLKEMNRGPPVESIEAKLRKDSRALVTESSKALSQFNKEKDELDPEVWQYVPWVGRHKEIPTPQLYNGKGWIGDYLFVATFQNYEIGAASMGLPQHHAEYYSPRDTTDRFRTIARDYMADVTIHVNMW